MRKPIAIAALVLAGVFAGNPVHAATPEIELSYPRKATAVRGEPALLEVVLAPEQAWLSGAQVEVDGELRDPFLPWKRRTVLSLSPAASPRVVVGRRRDGEPRRDRRPCRRLCFTRPSAHA
jgi:hypothetical protein